MRVRLTAQAKKDLRDTALFIAADNPPRAASFYDELETACLELREFPKRFQIVRSCQGFEVRRRVFGNHVILYRLDDDCVFVLRIVNGAMNIGALIAQERF